LRRRRKKEQNPRKGGETTKIFSGEILGLNEVRTENLILDVGGKAEIMSGSFDK